MLTRRKLPKRPPRRPTRYPLPTLHDRIVSVCSNVKPERCVHFKLFMILHFRFDDRFNVSGHVYLTREVIYHIEWYLISVVKCVCRKLPSGNPSDKSEVILSQMGRCIPRLLLLLVASLQLGVTQMTRTRSLRALVLNKKNAYAFSSKATKPLKTYKAFHTSTSPKRF